MGCRFILTAPQGIIRPPGYQALCFNTIGNNNTADGLNALLSNRNGSNNTATGLNALFNNTTGNGNIALGAFAGVNLTTGSNNIDIGSAGVAAESNTTSIRNIYSSVASGRETEISHGKVSRHTLNAFRNGAVDFIDWLGLPIRTDCAGEPPELGIEEQTNQKPYEYTVKL